MKTMDDLDLLDVQMKIKNRLIEKFWKELVAEYGEDRLEIEKRLYQEQCEVEPIPFYEQCCCTGEVKT